MTSHQDQHHSQAAACPSLVGPTGNPNGVTGRPIAFRRSGFRAPGQPISFEITFFRGSHRSSSPFALRHVVQKSMSGPLSLFYPNQPYTSPRALKRGPGVTIRVRDLIEE